MSAIIETTSWRASEVEASREDGGIVIEGNSAIGTRIRLVLRNDTVGAYDLGEGENEGILEDEGIIWTAFGTRSGMVTLKEIDEGHVAGSFGFRAKDTAGINPIQTVASGEFDVDFAE